MFRFKHKNHEDKMASGHTSQQPTGTKPGSPGNLNPGQQHMLDKFRKSIQDKGIFMPDRHDDACRTCIR